MDEQSLILSLSQEFRRAIDQACENGDFVQFQPFNRFPNGCCDFTSELLGIYLHENGIECEMVNGHYGSGYDSQNHVWLCFKREFHIDITADQFESNRALFNYSKPVFVGKPDQLHKLFLFNSRYEQIDICVLSSNDPFNPRHNALKKADRIIRKYL